MIQVIENMPAKEYHAVKDRMSASRLKQMAKGPAHCRWNMEHFKPTPAMEFGTLFHSVLLEPDIAEFAYAIRPRCERRSNADKETHRRFEEDCTKKGLIPIRLEEWDCACAMAQACRNTPYWQRLFGGPAKTELTIFWDDEEFGPSKMRADRVVDLAEFGRVCIDPKSCADSSLTGFPRQAINLGYDIQAYFHLRGLEAAGIWCDAFIFWAVESDPPHLDNLFAVERSGKAYDWGRRKALSFAWDYLSREKKNDWRLGILPLEFPTLQETE